MTITYYFFGPSDIAGQNPIERVPVEGGYMLNVDLSGNLPIIDFVRSDPDLSANAHEILLGLHEIRVPADVPINLVNLVGDADSSPKLLDKIQYIIDRVKPARVFNAPENVARTSRGNLPGTLAGIDNCVVPRVTMAHPSSREELLQLCREFDCWPLVIRERGCHSGENMRRIEDKGELDALQPSAWMFSDSGIFLMQFVDCRNSDGLYEKTRIVMVDGQPLPRHCIMYDQWAVNARTRAKLMDERVELRDRERDHLAWLNTSGIDQYRPVLDEMYRRIGLDIFGIDCFLQDGKLVVFEANACMSFLGDPWGGEDKYTYLVQYVADLRGAVKQLLLSS